MAWRILVCEAGERVLKRAIPSTKTKEACYDTFEERYQATLKVLSISKAACKDAVSEHGIELLVANPQEIYKI